MRRHPKSDLPDDAVAVGSAGSSTGISRRRNTITEYELFARTIIPTSYWGVTPPPLVLIGALPTATSVLPNGMQGHVRPLIPTSNCPIATAVAEN
jgi:hypothetical protein